MGFNLAPLTKGTYDVASIVWDMVLVRIQSVYDDYIGIDLEWIESAYISTLGMLDVSRQADDQLSSL